MQKDSLNYLISVEAFRYNCVLFSILDSPGTIGYNTSHTGTQALEMVQVVLKSSC